MIVIGRWPSARQMPGRGGSPSVYGQGWKASAWSIHQTALRLINLPRTRQARAVTSASDCRRNGLAVSYITSQARACLWCISEGENRGGNLSRLVFRHGVAVTSASTPEPHSVRVHRPARRGGGSGHHWLVGETKDRVASRISGQQRSFPCTAGTVYAKPLAWEALTLFVKRTTGMPPQDVRQMMFLPGKGSRKGSSDRKVGYGAGQYPTVRWLRG